MVQCIINSVYYASNKYCLNLKSFIQLQLLSQILDFLQRDQTSYIFNTGTQVITTEATTVNTLVINPATKDAVYTCKISGFYEFNFTAQLEINGTFQITEGTLIL